MCEPTDETGTVCLIVQLNEATPDEYRMLSDALKSALIPLGWAHRMALHATIDDAAQAVLDAYHGTVFR